MSLVLLFYKYKTFTIKEINKGIYIYKVSPQTMTESKY